MHRLTTLSSRLPRQYEIHSCMTSNFYGTKIQMWAVFGLVGNTERNIWGDYEQLLRAVFSCFHGQNNFFLNIVASVLKSCIK